MEESGSHCYLCYVGTRGVNIEATSGLEQLFEGAVAAVFKHLVDIVLVFERAEELNHHWVLLYYLENFLLPLQFLFQLKLFDKRLVHLSDGHEVTRSPLLPQMHLLVAAFAQQGPRISKVFQRLRATLDHLIL